MLPVHLPRSASDPARCPFERRLGRGTASGRPFLVGAGAAPPESMRFGGVPSPSRACGASRGGSGDELRRHGVGELIARRVAHCPGYVCGAQRPGNARRWRVLASGPAVAHRTEMRRPCALGSTCGPAATSLGRWSTAVAAMRSNGRPRSGPSQMGGNADPQPPASADAC
jgi:hypothetical protein